MEFTVSNGLQANSAIFDFARTSAPASRSLRTWKASLAGIEPFNDSEPAEVGMSAVLKLSLTMRGTQCRGPTKPDRANLASSASAAGKTFGLIMMIALSAGPFLSYAAMRSRYIWTSWRHVTCRASSAARMSAIVASCIDSRESTAPSHGVIMSRALTIRTAAIDGNDRHFISRPRVTRRCPFSGLGRCRHRAGSDADRSAAATQHKRLRWTLPWSRANGGFALKAVIQMPAGRCWVVEPVIEDDHVD